MAELILTADEKKFIVCDCRYPFEYEGGHVINAININNEDDLVHLYENIQVDIIIFHCEFSVSRAPKICSIFRSIDRTNNIYPNLKFPEVYLLKGGYKEFFKNHANLCTPKKYVKMNDRRFKKQLEIEEKKRNKRIKMM